MNRESTHQNNMIVERTKKCCFFLLAIISNIAPLGLCYFYDFGGPLLLLAFPFIHILLFLVNNKCANTWLQVITLGMLHIVVTACTHLQCGWLYLNYVWDDIIGRAISEGLYVIGTGIAIILTIISVVKFYRKQKRKANF